MGFAEGFRTGSGLVQQVIENQRQAELDTRTGEEHERKKALWKREDEAYGRTEDAYRGLQDVRAGITPDYKAEAKQRFGVDDARLAEWSKLPGGLPAKLQQLEGFNAQVDESGGNRAEPLPQRAPIALGKPDAVGEARALGDIAVAQRDVAGIRAARADVRSELVRKHQDSAAQMTDDDAYAYVRKNMNTSGGLPLVVSKQGKNGYRVTSYDQEGHTKDTLLNPAQMKQLAASHMMSQDPNGLGTEALTMAAGIHKDLAELVAKYNTTEVAMATQNNAATHQGRTDQLGAERNKIAAGHLALAKERSEIDKLSSADTWVDEKTGDTYKSVLQMGKKGPEMVGFKIGGKDGSISRVDSMPPGLKKVGTGKADTTEHTVPAEGERVRIGNKIFKYDRDGSKIPQEQLTTSELEKSMIDVGIKPEMVGGSIQRAQDGSILFGVNRYNPHDPKDMALLATEVERLGRNTAVVEEENRNSPHAAPERQGLQLERQGRAFVPY